MLSLPEALAPLGRYRQFITWLPVTRPDGKVDKFPCDYRTGEVRDAHDASIWTDSASAIAAAAATRRGVGFVFTTQDPFWFIDIDSAWDGQAWSPVAQQLCEVFAGAAIEVSQSGKGLHIFGSGPVPAHAKKNKQWGLELYDDKRFVALTGTNAIGNADWRGDERMGWFAATYMPFNGVEPDTDSDLSDAPREGWRGPTDDADLIRRALMSTSAAAAFGGNRASFADLWNANVDVLARAYPSATGGEYDRSSADAALAQHLAFWTGAHGQRIERLMRQSLLAREKWDLHASYMLLTIRSACARQVDVLADKPAQWEIERPAADPPAPARPPSPGVDSVEVELPEQTVAEGTTFMTLEMQRAQFKGCVYVTDAHAILTPGGELMKPDQFKVRFGGYTFSMDNANERTSRDAWEAFTQSQILRAPKVETTCFRPDLRPGTILTVGGRKKVNSFFPVNVPRTLGVPTPFLTHLALVLPNERDAKILLCYLAACVQHMGVKFQWAPLLQGVEGNGKSFFTECVVNAVGERYTHLPRADQISAQFNSWVRNKIVIGVEDVFVPDAKVETWEILKPMITARRLPVEPKGVDQGMVDVCCNWILNSNHKDGLRKTENDRRLGPLFCAQQKKSDLKRDGLTEEYFASLYHWYLHGGMGVVNEFLYTYPIDPELNPASGRIAPITTSTAEAIEAGRSAIEQNIQEAIETELPGFAGGWVSSLALDKLLKNAGADRRIPLSKRRALMQGFGYDWHPHLPNGRVNNTIAPDSGKPRLFVKPESPLAAITSAADVARAYTSAQSAAATA